MGAILLSGTGMSRGNFSSLAACLFFEQAAFLAFTPLVAAERSVRANDAVAGDDDRELVRRTSACDGSARGRLANRLGNLAIGPAFARGNLLERRPDLHLELGAREIEWNAMPGVIARCAHAIDHRPHPR